MLKVSVVIPFYNCPFINQALDSLVNQTYKNMEIIVVNDGSNLYVEKINPYLDRIIYLEKENGGTASALNLGIQHSTGEYLCWLSSDDQFFLNKIETQLHFMKRKNALFSYTNYYLINENGRRISDPLGVKVEGRAELLKKLNKENFINGSSIMLRKDILQHLGKFDETLMYTHDYEFWLRVVLNFPIHYLAEPLLQHRIHKNMGTRKHEAAIKKETNLIINNYKSKIKELINNEQF